MLFQEPPATRFDLRFVFAGFPVRVHPLFWLVTLLLAARNPSIVYVLIWIAAVFVSILIHELGHAAVLHHYGWRARIILYGMGGLAVPQDRPGYGTRSPSWRESLIISLGGPVAGFLFAAVVLIAVLSSGHSSYFLFWKIGGGMPLPNDVLRGFVSSLLYINILWGVANLMPVRPLDGGQAATAILVHRNQAYGYRKALQVSVVAGAVVCVVFLFLGAWFAAILFGYLGFLSYDELRRRHGTPSVRSWFARKKETVVRARDERRRSKQMKQDAASILERTDELEAERPADIVREADDLLESVVEQIRTEREAKKKKSS